jgi:hypothetical protein
MSEALFWLAAHLDEVRHYGYLALAAITVGCLYVAVAYWEE